MSTEFASSVYTMDQMNAVVKILRKQAGDDAVERLLRGELTVSAPTLAWIEVDGVIYFYVTSDGTTGEQWIARLEQKGFRVSDYAKGLLRSKVFKPTSGVTTKVAVLRGSFFSVDRDRTTRNVRAEADLRKWMKPNAEVACLIREKFSDEDLEKMDLWWIIAMHEPIEVVGIPYLLTARRLNDGRWLNTYWDHPDNQCDRGDGFAFALKQIGV
jgi:hypothetical protein